MAEHNQRFDSFQEWVNKASSWLTRHPRYNNTENGETKGWRGRHFTAMCFDSKGRRVCNGGDFMQADAEGAFPVYWIWPDQLLELAVKDKLPELSALENRSSGLADAAPNPPASP